MPLSCPHTTELPRVVLSCQAAVQALLFLEELTSILLTPFVLWWSLPQCAPAIVAFVRDHTVRVPGVGDVCSLAAFSLPMHGNPKYGSPYKAAKVGRALPELYQPGCLMAGAEL